MGLGGTGTGKTRAADGEVNGSFDPFLMLSTER